jgi:hypothetical protein
MGCAPESVMVAFRTTGAIRPTDRNDVLHAILFSFEGLIEFMGGFWIRNHQAHASVPHGQSKHVDVPGDGVRVCYDDTPAETVIQARNGPIKKLGIFFSS